MQLPDLPNTQEALSGKPQQMEFTVKPSGEFHFKGIPDPDIVERLIVGSDYHRDKHREAVSKAEALAANEARTVNLLTIGFLGLSTLIILICVFLNFSRPTGGINYGGNREPIRGYCP